MDLQTRKEINTQREGMYIMVDENNVVLIVTVNKIENDNPFDPYFM